MKLLLLLLVAINCADRQINWSGYQWRVKDSPQQGPGWSQKNVFVDQEGNLHMQITNNNGLLRWCQLQTNIQFQFGTYEWWLNSRIDLLDKNIVVGLFLYPTNGELLDGTNQIDIEFAQWGNSSNNPLWFSVWPRERTVERIAQDFNMSLRSNLTTHRFNWRQDRVIFQSLHGHQTGFNGMFANWTTPNTFIDSIPVMSLRLMMNFWLYHGLAPSDGQNAEIVIKQFRHY